MTSRCRGLVGSQGAYLSLPKLQGTTTLYNILLRHEIQWSFKTPSHPPVVLLKQHKADILIWRPNPHGGLSQPNWIPSWLWAVTARWGKKGRTGGEEEEERARTELSKRLWQRSRAWRPGPTDPHRPASPRAENTRQASSSSWPPTVPR